MTRYILVAVALLAFWYFMSKNEPLTTTLTGEMDIRARLPNTDQSRPPLKIVT